MKACALLNRHPAINVSQVSPMLWCAAARLGYFCSQNASIADHWALAQVFRL